MAVRKINAKGDFEVLPVRHLSARVPWHDNKWNGSIVVMLENSFLQNFETNAHDRPHKIEEGGRW
jgi:hypothetical protein